MLNRRYARMPKRAGSSSIGSVFKVSAEGLVVFVTGANKSNGIGRALVEEAIKRGAKKVYATARDIAQLDDLIEKFQDKVVPIELDVTNLEHIQEAVQRASDTQVLINNAGVSGLSGGIYHHDEKTARQQMEVNYFGPLRLMHTFAENLIRNGHGAIVNIISIGGLYPSPELVTYSASKAALYSLTRAVRIEMMRHAHSIPVFGVYPGPIDTDMSGVYTNVESAANVAIRVFDGMEQGIIDITTDVLSDNFSDYLRPDFKIIDALKKAFVK